jgi:hypothetical protein
MQTKHIVLFFVCIFYVTLVYLVKDHQLFWDTVQFGGKHPNFFFHNEHLFILPNTLDSGHIPAFGYYISLCWKIFGRSIQVTHFAMLPFLMGMGLQIYNYIKFEISGINGIVIFLFILIEPTLLAQSILVSPDIVLIFFFFLLLNSLRVKNNIFIVISTLGLVLISNRGVMVLIGIYMFQFISAYFNREKVDFKNYILLLPSVTIFLIYHTYHYYKIGWVFYHEHSPWAPCFEKADGVLLMKNVILFFHRLFDFGRVIYLIFILFGIKMFIKIEEIRTRNFILLFTLCISLGYSFIVYKGLNGHRYILPLILIMELIVLNHVVKTRYKTFGLSIILLFLIGGHFLKYPSYISQGWDASLAHIGYYNCSQDIYRYLKDKGIDGQDVFSTFPFVAKLGDQYINDDVYQLSDAWSDKINYILTSDLNPIDEADVYLNDFHIEKSYSCYGTKYFLYRRNIILN